MAARDQAQTRVDRLRQMLYLVTSQTHYRAPRSVGRLDCSTAFSKSAKLAFAEVICPLYV
jgi:hypothetical protein